MARQKYIACDIFKRGVTVFVGTKPELAEWVRKEFTSPGYAGLIRSVVEEECGEADCYHGNGSVVVRVGEFPGTPVTISLLGHELLHATFYILQYVGVEFSDGSNETFTYLYEWLLKCALEEKGYKNVPCKQPPT